MIEVLPAGWGGAVTENVHAVCVSVAECYAHVVREMPLAPILVEPTAEPHAPPFAVFERTSAGQVRIQLSSRGTRWAQFAFQFAHEYCHVLANARPPAIHRAMWIEESLCEASSLFALRTMGRKWADAPPYENWRDFAPHLIAYADSRIADPLHQLPEGTSFGQWLTSALPAMEDNPLRREDNTRVAKELLPVFEDSPETWMVVRYLNTWPFVDLSSQDFVAIWRRAVPERLQSHFDRLAHRITTLAADERS